MKKVAILQSNYIPWKGYFDMIHMVDEFILYDDAQYTKRDWRNRNQIKTSFGLQWLTIPVKVKGKYYQKIKDTVVSDSEWFKKHWGAISHNYGKARFFKDFKSLFEELYLGCEEKYLSSINYRFIIEINKLLDITTKIKWSMEYDLSVEGNTEKLLHLCMQADADIYISGPAAKDYMDEELFRKQGIKLLYMDYSGYQEYKQLYPPFKHRVTILDLIFNEGLNATKFMNSF